MRSLFCLIAGVIFVSNSVLAEDVIRLKGVSWSVEFPEERDCMVEMFEYTAKDKLGVERAYTKIYLWGAAFPNDGRLPQTFVAETSRLDELAAKEPRIQILREVRKGKFPGNFKLMMELSEKPLIFRIDGGPIWAGWDTPRDWKHQITCWIKEELKQ